jgi:hypothetical protein
MTTSNDATLVLVPYLQSWNRDRSLLKLSLLLVPRVSPLDPLTSGSVAFVDARFDFAVYLQKTPSPLPLPGGTPYVTVPSPVVSTARPIFELLGNLYPIDPSPKRAVRGPGNRVRKYAPPSYQKAVGYAPGKSELLVTDHQYFCALKLGSKEWTYKPLPKPNPLVSWGKVVAILLRNPALARAAGLIRDLEVPITVPNDVKDAGFVHVTLASTSDAASLIGLPAGLKIHVARFPKLVASRKLFTPVVFPVVSPPPSADYGDVFAEAEDYDDGWTKAVHCSQPQRLDPSAEASENMLPVREQGIQIGWDDEQVTIWMDRQLANSGSYNSPICVQGYRIDVRLSSESMWHSLVRALGPLGVPGVDLGPFDDELAVEVHPAQLEAEKTGEFWLPTYFSQWAGTSLVGLDRDRLKISGVANPTPGPPVKAVAPTLALVYGRKYDFRVRIADHTGGGPDVGDSPVNPGPNPIDSWHFKRWIAPTRPRLVEKIPGTPDPANAPTILTFKRPLMSSPGVICTGYYDNSADTAVNRLLADLPAAQAERREAGLADPDVDRLQISVEVDTLRQDPAGTDGTFWPLFTTTRPFPDDLLRDLALDITWEDIHDVTQLAQPSSGPLKLPSARLVRLRFTALCRDDPLLDYFGAQMVRTGPSKVIELLKHPEDETRLFLGGTVSQRFSAYYLQPDPPIDPSTIAAQKAMGNSPVRPPDIATRFAAALGLRNDCLTIRAQPGRRVVFGCSSALQYVLGPDRASISFSAGSDLALKWLTVIRLTIDRDWSWAGLADEGIVVRKDGVKLERFTPTRDVNHDALLTPDRSQTDLVYIDAINPKPAGGIPQQLHPVYSISCSFLGNAAADAPLQLKIDLPVTTPPSQIPRIASAGIAMTPYKRSDDYSHSEIRGKALWIELSEPVTDERDAYFARVLYNAPDPLLALSAPGASDIDNEQRETALPVDAEWVRKIVPGQADDFAGLAAMQRLIPSDSPLHFALPFPTGMTEQAPELFGFFTYEFRVGHDKLWTTAQGRFGPPLRVTGVQHPAPQLICSVKRAPKGIQVSAPFALAVRNKVISMPGRPRSSIWIMLYAQAAQIDRADHCNILLQVVRTGYEQDERIVNTSPHAEVFIPFQNFMSQLVTMGLDAGAPLSVLAVEMIPQVSEPQLPLSGDLGNQRILRTSPLTPVPQMCG